MLKNSLRTLALLSVAAPTLAASNFDYLSGGYLYQNAKNGISKSVDSKGKVKEKKNLNGIYLDLNKEIYNRVFISGHLRDTQSLKDYTFGVGYHYPISAQVDIYGVVGVSKLSIQNLECKSGHETVIRNGIKAEAGQVVQKTMQVMQGIEDSIEVKLQKSQENINGIEAKLKLAQENTLLARGIPNYRQELREASGTHEQEEVREATAKREVLKELDGHMLKTWDSHGQKLGENKLPLTTTGGVKGKLAPSIEVGVKAAINEQFGLATSYRYAQHKIESKKLKQHEARVSGYYNITDKIAAEAGYTFTKLKAKELFSKDPSINSLNLGVRFYF